MSTSPFSRVRRVVGESLVAEWFSDSFLARSRFSGVACVGGSKVTGVFDGSIFGEEAVFGSVLWCGGLLVCEGIRTSHGRFFTEEVDCCCAGWGGVPASGSALSGHSHKVLLLTNCVDVISHTRYLVDIFPGVEGFVGLSRLPLCSAVLSYALPCWEIP